MKYKEVGGDSSPVDFDGILMMEKSFFKTKLLAEKLSYKRLAIYENILGRKCNNVLEIGCGPGVFYNPMKKLSIDWHGLEINPFWLSFGKKNNIPISDLKINKIKKKFDVVTAHQVLEHVEKPDEFVKMIKEVLNPGGVLHLELPNNNSLTSKIRQFSPKLSNDFGFIQPPMHLRAFSKKSLSYLLNQNNFNFINVFTCGNNDSTWGQVRKYSIFQKMIFSFSALIKSGSILVGLAKK